MKHPDPTPVAHWASRWLLRKLGARTEGLTEFERERCARVFERAANMLENNERSALAAELRATGLQLIDAASRPYPETPVR
jgi:hypothetical protein